MPEAKIFEISGLSSLSGATLCGDRACQTRKRVVKCEFFGGRARPFRTKRGPKVKNWCKIPSVELQTQPFRTKSGRRAKTCEKIEILQRHKGTPLQTFSVGKSFCV